MAEKKYIVELLKSGKYGLHHAWGPIVEFEIGDTFVVGEELKKRMVEADKWAKEIGEAPGYAVIGTKNFDPKRSVKKPVKVEKVEKTPEDIEQEYVDGNDDEEKESGDEEELPAPKIEELMSKLKDVSDVDARKTIIQDWGELNLNVKVTKSKSEKNMIKELKKAMG